MGYTRMRTFTSAKDWSLERTVGTEPGAEALTTFEHLLIHPLRRARTANPKNG